MALQPALSASPDPLDAAWLESHLKSGHPRLIWQEGDEARIQQRVAKDPAARAYHQFLMAQADGIMQLPGLERVVTGRRLLSVSREALKRLSTLGYAWRLTGEERYMDGLERQLLAVCGFSDWNPSHFLDTAEMALGVALALDWADDGLSLEVRRTAREALLEKGLEAGEIDWVQYVFQTNNNWSQVCNAGMVAAALVLAGDHPEAALHALNRMRAGIPRVLETYAPDGVYIEGATYWSYGTKFQTVLIEVLRTALGTDFGQPDYTGFMESADFIHLMKAPSGDFYNFFDCGDRSDFLPALLWFARETGNARHAQREAMIVHARRGMDPAGGGDRLGAAAFLWYCRADFRESDPLPLNWVGQGENPLGVFRTAFGDPEALYLAFKGGRGTLNHGNMDAGSFILELDGVRWSVDPGNQSYHPLEEYFKEHGGSLWSRNQESARWHLLTKNNFAHSTLTVDEAPHLNTGQAEIIAFDPEARTATLDMSGPLAGRVETAQRTFAVPDDRTVRITDRLFFVNPVETIRWQLVTQAEVRTRPGGATLYQEGKSLELTLLQPAGLQVSVTSLNPGPHPMDKEMPGLKRLDLVIPSHLVERERLVIEVELSRPGQ